MAIVIGGFLVLYFLLTPLTGAVGLGQIGATLSAMPLAAVGWVHQVLKTGRLRPNLTATPEDAVAPPDYYLPWYQIAVYAGLALTAILQLGSFLGAFTFALLGATLDQAASAGGGGGFVLALAGAFLLGNWIGDRAQDRYLVAAIAAAFIGTVAGVIVDAAGMAVGMVPQSSVAELLGLRLLIHFIPWAVASSLGVWRIRRRPRLAYLRFLSARLSPDQREALTRHAIELAAAPVALSGSAAASPSVKAWKPSHRTAPDGMSAWAQPDPSHSAIAHLDGGLEVVVVERRADWALVVASNGWEGWVDARRLKPIA